MSERKDDTLLTFSRRLAQQLNLGNKLALEMERKRRDEEALRQEHERKQRGIQAEALKESAILNKDVDDEIARIGAFDGFEPFQALINERSILQKKVAQCNFPEEKELLLKQLAEVDNAVKN